MTLALLYLSVTALSAVIGFVVGLLGARARAPHEIESAEMPPEVEQNIQAAAARWAGARGRPWAAPLIADKLRLAYRLRHYAGSDRGRS
jgi:hypothetical protein